MKKPPRSRNNITIRPLFGHNGATIGADYGCSAGMVLAIAEAKTMTQVTSQEAFEDMAREVALLKAENARLLANKSTVNGIKLSSKGGVSVYGLGRFPVTLYQSQWLSLLAKADEIKAFMVANASQLASKSSD